MASGTCVDGEREDDEGEGLSSGAGGAKSVSGDGPDCQRLSSGSTCGGDGEIVLGEIVGELVGEIVLGEIVLGEFSCGGSPPL